MPERPVPEADALEQDQPVGGAPARVDPVDHDTPLPDAPLPDAVEQDQPAGGSMAAEEPVIPTEVPEADAIEQAQPGPLVDEDEGPR